MATKNIVLVHGNFVDGSGWQGVYEHLTADGYRVAVVQNPTLSLDGDVAATRQVLDTLDGPAVLVGHSYGGVVITEAGNHPNVAALVYITAFAPDTGESVSSMIADPPPGAPIPPILPPVNGLLFLDRDQFAASFAADVPQKLAAFMADSQVPAGVDALNGAVSEPAWRSKPSWYLVAADDHMIPPAAQRAMSERAKATVTETPGSHAVYVSRPAVVAAVISQAARGRLPGSTVSPYANFFIASAGASAAILGLLVVAVSVVNADDANPTTRENRTVLAGSAFVALVDIFIVSIVALTGGSVVFGLSSLAMAAVGLLATRRLIPRASRAGNFSRGFRARRLNIAFALISAGGYSVQLGLGVALLANTRSAPLECALVLVIVALYCSALARAWEVTGITRRGLWRETGLGPRSRRH